MTAPGGAAGLARELAGIVGPNGLVDPVDAPGVLADTRNVHSGEALAIVRPASTEEVAAVVRLCASTGVAVVAQGGNTGLSGGAIPGPTERAVVLVLSRLDAVESIDPDRWTVTAQAGVTVEALQDAAAGVDRLFAPDWGARGTATVGGAIATDAGGNNVLRYGNMRDQVLGLEVVLPDGRVWDGLRALRKDSSGYDLKQLFIGAEGTLGIVTRAVLKLHPATPEVLSALAAIADLDRLMELYQVAHAAAPGVVTAFELVPDVGIDRVCSMLGWSRPIDTRAEFYALVKLASSRPVDDAMARLLDRAVVAGLVTDAIVAGTPEQEARLWTIRDELPPPRSYPDTQSVGLKMDTAVPIDQLGAYHDAVRRISAELVPNALVYGFGHVGDGNLHMMVLPLGVEEMAEFDSRKPELLRRIDAATFELGGTLSAEHGIGRELRGRIRAQKPEIEWELMRAIKGMLDPSGLMNPGAVLPD